MTSMTSCIHYNYYRKGLKVIGIGNNFPTKKIFTLQLQVSVKCIQGDETCMILVFVCHIELALNSASLFCPVHSKKSLR